MESGFGQLVFRTWMDWLGAHGRWRGDSLRGGQGGLRHGCNTRDFGKRRPYPARGTGHSAPGSDVAISSNRTPACGTQPFGLAFWSATFEGCHLPGRLPWSARQRQWPIAFRSCGTAQQFSNRTPWSCRACSFGECGASRGDWRNSPPRRIGARPGSSPVQCCHGTDGQPRDSTGAPFFLRPHLWRGGSCACARAARRNSGRPSPDFF